MGILMAMHASCTVTQPCFLSCSSELELACSIVICQVHRFYKNVNMDLSDVVVDIPKCRPTVRRLIVCVTDVNHCLLSPTF